MELENGIESLSLTNSENKGPKFLNLKTSDDEIFKVDWETLFQSAAIRNMLDDLGITENEDKTAVIPLPKVTGRTLKKALVWCEKHKGLPDAIVDTEIDMFKETPKNPLEMSGWEKKYIDISTEEKFELIHAANYLDIKGLLILACKGITLLIKGKSVEKIRENLEFEDPKWTEEELKNLQEKKTSLGLGE